MSLSSLSSYSGELVDSDPLAEYEADPDLMYVGVDLETGALSPE
jgi:hypothetical protein